MRQCLLTLEENIPWSQSRLWDWQATFFARAGVAAWADKVPFYVTSNSVIAHSYAQIITRYIQDLSRQLGNDAQRTVHVIELGAGTGQFSYYCLCHLVRLYQRLRLPNKPCYVMTDFAQANLDFWQSQPLFKPFIEEGFLDMALFDVDSPQPLFLQHRQRFLSAAEPESAVVCLANYVFDSTRHDVFHIKDQELKEGLVSLLIPSADGQGQETAPSLSDVSLSFTLRGIDPRTYYANAAWSAVLTDYGQDKGLEGHFVFPTAMFRALEFLEQIGSGRLLLISSDKGYTTPQQIMGRGPPKLTHHGSFSITVNYDAVRRYVKVRGGLSFPAPPGAGLRTCVYALGSGPDDLLESAAAVDIFVQQYGPYDCYQLSRHLRKSPLLSLSAGVAHLRSGHWDPYLVSSIRQQLLESLKESPNDEWKTALHDGLLQAEKLIYPLPGMRDYYFDLATLQAALADTKSAIRLLRASLQRFPECFASYFNLGLCYSRSGDSQSATAAFEKARQYEKVEVDGPLQLRLEAEKQTPKVSSLRPSGAAPASVAPQSSAAPGVRAPRRNPQH